MNKKIQTVLLCAGSFIPATAYAQVAISALPSATALSGTEVIPVVQSATTKKTAVSNIGPVIGTTPIVNGANTKVLYDNAGVIGEYVISGTGNVAMTTSPVFTTPNLGVPTFITLTNGTGLVPSTGLAATGTPAGNNFLCGNNTWGTCGVTGTGTVTNVATGTGLSGGPISTTGTISLANTAVTAGTYGDATHVGQVVVDAQGRITGASNVSITGGGTVTNVATGNCLTGGPITTTGTIGGTYLIDARSTTSETINANDACRLVTFSNTSAVAATIAQATGAFGLGWSVDLQNLGNGSVTLTPTTSTINGGATLVIPKNTGCTVVSDNTNYQVAQCTAVMPYPASGSIMLSAGTGSTPTAYAGAANCAASNAVIGINANGTTNCATVGGGSSVVPNFITGLVLSNDGVSPNTKLDISAGTASDTTNAASMAPGAFTKTTATWASGTGNGGMGNGLTVANGTWYFVCLANNAGTPDYWFDTSSTCANKPSGISDTKYRVIGMFSTCTAVLCNAGASTNIAAFKAFTIPGGVRTLWNYDNQNDGQDVNSVSLTSQTRTLKTLSVPTGFKVMASFTATDGGNGHSLRLMAPDEPDLTIGTDATNANGAIPPDIICGAASYCRIDFERSTNTSAQIAVRSGGTVTSSFSIWTRGWDWDRGLNGS